MLSAISEEYEKPKKKKRFHNPESFMFKMGSSLQKTAPQASSSAEEITALSDRHTYLTADPEENWTLPSSVPAREFDPTVFCPRNLHVTSTSFSFRESRNWSKSQEIPSFPVLTREESDAKVLHFLAFCI